ncbi:hypothetical protein [uncultured Vagococcus sp.]|uniref:hypothetical protein n=1 Tax=uncultured Vagococcus sp. TaxID=189676 RepID=UPI0028D346E8|nr:hypothetical protein [uncultured Vagococcus sp.]
MKYVIDDFNMTETAFWNSIIFTTIIAIIGVVIAVGLSYLVIKKISAKNLEQLTELSDKTIDAQRELNKQQLAKQETLNSSQTHLQTELLKQNEQLTNNQLSASLKAQAQIEWVTDVRKLVADYITATTSLSQTLASLYAGHKILTDSENRAIDRGYDLETIAIDAYSPMILQRYQNDRDNYATSKGLYDRQQGVIIELATRLNLFFGNNPDHEELRGKIRWFLKAERDFFKFIEEADDLSAVKLSRQYTNNIDDLSESFRRHFHKVLHNPLT